MKCCRYFTTGSVADGRTLTFTSGGSTYEGVVNTSIVNTATGFIQYADPTRQDIVASGDEGLEVTGGSGYLSAFFQTDFDTVAKFYSSDGTAQTLM